MKKAPLVLLIIIILTSCAPVLRYDLMKGGIRGVPPSAVRDNPEANRGRLFILGGIIVDTRVTEEGTLIEAIYVPVDSYGYLKGTSPVDGRYLALYEGFLDPLIFKRDREITLAGEFVENRRGMIGEMEYIYPLFMIKQIYLWEERKYYYISPPPPPWYYPPWWYDPWWRYY
jgi:outer membrane lipoprotein